jgi:murein DD-endopeptidase MepM/ murein hydrolase activator NlpD
MFRPRGVVAGLAVSVLIGAGPALAVASPAPPPSPGGGSTVVVPSSPSPTPAPWVVVLPQTREYLRMGDAGGAVTKLQLKLRAHHQIAVRPTGTFGAATFRAVRSLQRAYHLRVSGVAGVTFLKKIGLTVKISAPQELSTSSITSSRTKYLRTFPIHGTSAHPYSPTLFPYADVWNPHSATNPINGAQLPAALGTTVVAPCNVMVTGLTPVPTGLGGWFVWMTDTTGTTYLYSHLNGYATGLHIGQQLSTGQAVGTVGNSGDAAGGPPFLYLEIHPGGGAPVDPFPDLEVLNPAPSAH